MSITFLQLCKCVDIYNNPISSQLSKLFLAMTYPTIDEVLDAARSYAHESGFKLRIKAKKESSIRLLCNFEGESIHKEGAKLTAYVN